ncbi:unnamed protein product [Choristocarpus tenellus]
MMEPSMMSLNAPDALQFMSPLEHVGDGDNSNGVGRDGTSGGGGPVGVGLTVPLTPVPVETLAMLSDHLLILDTHDRIFIWSGSAVCGKEFDPLRQACLEHISSSAASRFPSAPVAFLKDGSSWSRYLTSRLIPSHKDSPEQQLMGFPALASVPRAELEGLRCKLPQTDDPSYHTYFWRVCGNT